MLFYDCVLTLFQRSKCVHAECLRALHAYFNRASRDGLSLSFCNTLEFSWLTREKAELRAH